jgi:hypothetical protein
VDLDLIRRRATTRTRSARPSPLTSPSATLDADAVNVAVTPAAKLCGATTSHWSSAPFALQSAPVSSHGVGHPSSSQSVAARVARCRRELHLARAAARHDEVAAAVAVHVGGREIGRDRAHADGHGRLEGAVPAVAREDDACSSCRLAAATVAPAVAVEVDQEHAHRPSTGTVGEHGHTARSRCYVGPRSGCR